MTDDLYEGFFSGISKLSKEDVGHPISASSQSNDTTSQDKLIAELRDRKHLLADLPTNVAQEVVAPGANQTEEADVVIITALALPELKFALQALGGTWQDTYQSGWLYKVQRIEFGWGHLRAAVVCQNAPGMVNTAITAIAALHAWKPKVIVLLGICAGLKGKVDLGDVVVAESVFDYGAGKITPEGVAPSYAMVPTHPTLLQLCNDIKTKASLLGQIHTNWETSNKPKTSLVAHVGVLASGSAVVADPEISKGVEAHQRKLIAFDMEAFGLMRALSDTSGHRAKGLVIKGVCDFGDEHKNDSFQDYASWVSAKFLELLLTTHGKDILEVM